MWDKKPIKWWSPPSKTCNFVTPFRSQHLKHQDTSCLLCCDGSCSPLYLHDWVLSVGHMVGNTWAIHTKHVIKVVSWSNHRINNNVIVFMKPKKQETHEFVTKLWQFCHIVCFASSPKHDANPGAMLSSFLKASCHQLAVIFSQVTRSYFGANPKKYNILEYMIEYPHRFFVSI